ncbi:hypothetical protein B1H19_04405 [Streptomyces gilvosporeus]|uniref:Uncharacterized protein n=1 Tax=Streptomyces gilvosporeus TaxID=553510 RepID=A0A1V0TKT0_9ACTN|nr:hypothetical protein B1H19_04405 [Streptomyces gilvosporeus]
MLLMLGDLPGLFRTRQNNRSSHRPDLDPAPGEVLASSLCHHMAVAYSRGEDLEVPHASCPPDDRSAAVSRIRR